MPEMKKYYDIEISYGICSDYVSKYKNNDIQNPQTKDS